jgi:hypothetical protein
MSALASQPLRRSARLVSKDNTPIRSSAPVAVPSAPRKAHVPKEGFALVSQFLAKYDDASARIDARIKTAMEDLELLERTGEEEEYMGTVQYLFTTLFASSDFGSLRAHDYHELYDLVKRVHEGNLAYPISHTSCIKTGQGWNRICFLLSEIGFPTSSMW